MKIIYVIFPCLEVPTTQSPSMMLSTEIKTFGHNKTYIYLIKIIKILNQFLKIILSKYNL